MKKLILFACILLLQYTAHAQTYVPFPTENATWRLYSNVLPVGVPNGHKAYIERSIVRDSFFNGSSYHLLLDNVYGYSYTLGIMTRVQPTT